MIKPGPLLKKEITVETRALIDSPDEIREKLKSLGAVQGKTERIVDEYYADLAEATPTKHTYEKGGRAARVRRITIEGETRIEAVLKEGLTKTAEGTFSHDVVQSKIIFKGKPSQVDQGRELVKRKGFPELVLVIKKIREIYSFKGMRVYLELVENFGPAIEIKTEVGNGNQLTKVKKAQVDFSKELGVKEEDVFETSHTHLLVSARITSDPKVKRPYLQKKLEKLEKKLREKMKGSNLAYRESGDAWHDNLGWDSLMNEADLLRARIREVREGLVQIEGSS